MNWKEGMLVRCHPDIDDDWSDGQLHNKTFMLVSEQHDRWTVETLDGNDVLYNSDEKIIFREEDEELVPLTIPEIAKMKCEGLI